jgi:hypothetical protein
MKIASHMSVHLLPVKTAQICRGQPVDCPHGQSRG